MTGLAKLTLPRLGDALLREPLFRRIDLLRNCPGVWVQAPAGAGKTTLLSSYIETRKLAALWYEIDSGDHDVASFFHHLALARERLAGTPGGLPRFTSEFVTAPQVFARRYFRELYASVAEPILLVLDSFEDGEESDRLCDVVREAIAQAPPHVNVIVLGRNPPPAALARFLANGRMSTMDPGELLLGPDEAVVIARRRNVDEATALKVHAEAEGWAAGFRLMLEGVIRVGSAADARGSKQELFDYFIEQLFKVGSEETQRVLIDLALLPYVTRDLARAVSTSTRAIDVVECLARQHLFAQRRAGERAEAARDAQAYRFHGLFRSFLEQQLARTRGENGVRALALLSGKALQAHGDDEAALDLYIRAEAWQDAIVLIRRLSNTLLRQMRCMSLIEWIRALPPALVDDDHWLLYALGAAHLCVDPREARTWFEASYALAAARGDEECLVRSTAAIVDAAFLEYSEFKSIDKCIAVLRDALQFESVRTNPDTELRASVALLAAVFYSQGDMSELPALAERTLALALGQSDHNLRAAALAWLLSYAGNSGRFELAARILPAAAVLIEHAEVTPVRRGLCAYFAAWSHVSMCNPLDAVSCMQVLLRLAEDFGLDQLRRFAAIIGFWSGILRQDPDEARRWIEQFEQSLGQGHPYDIASLHAMRALLAQLHGDAVGATRHARLALPAYEQVGSPWHRSMVRSILLWSAVETGDQLQTRKLLAELRALARESRLHAYMLGAYQAEAWLAMQAGDSRKLVEKLLVLFENAQQFGVGMPMRFIVPWMPRLCAEALHCGVCAPYVAGLIRAYRWSAPLPGIRQWPWPVKIQTLGRFSIHVDEEPISFTAKAPRKALALLKALICASGMEVRDHQLIDALWKDDEADAARAAFNVTLHRLRRLLGHPDAIEVTDGCLTLNPRVVWVDAIAYERLLAATSDPGVTEIDEALSLYRGPLLPTDCAESWSAAARERLRAKFLHHLGRRARQLEAEGRWEDAIALYLRGLDADNLSESFYQGLMRCHKECGQHAEALSLYWRLRQTLSVSLGISPSCQTEVLFQEIGHTARSMPL